MGVFWLAENMRWGPLIGCEHDSASFPWFPWMACQNEPQSPAHSPLLPPSIGLSACVHFCEVNVHMWYMWEWKLYVLRVCVCICHQNMGWGLRCFSLQGEVFTPSHLHPTSPLLINVLTCESLTWPDPSPSPSPAEHAGCRDTVLWSWVLSNARDHKTDWSWF